MRAISTTALGLLAFCSADLWTGRPAWAGPLVAETFEQTDATATADPRGGATATAAFGDAGTIDSYFGKPGRCATLNAVLPAGKADAAAALVLDLRRSGEASTTDPARLTVSFDGWTDRVRPVAVRLASLDAAGRVTGTLGGVARPPAGGAWYRHAFDLSDLKPVDGRFDPAAPRVRLAVELTPFGDDAAPATLRVDNVSLSAPSFYVSEKGSDAADGRTEATAFATVQRGIDAAGPGDTVMLLTGTYRNSSVAGIATIAKAGTPAAWITLRSAPGHTPKLVNTGWEVVKILPGSAYVELRGLDIGGNRANVKLEDALADGVIKERDGKKYGGDPLFNGNGVSAEGRAATKSSDRPHHLRFIGNHVHDNCGGGISAIACDYVTAEGNDVHDNAHYMRYGGSGISYLNLSNFDDSRGHRAFVLNNVVRRNRCYVPWITVGHLSDGNNIIIDVNRHAKKLDGDYNGRTLIANNLSVHGGGGGITVTTSAHVDIVHNTLYHNLQTEELAFAKYPWGDLFMSGPLPNCQDVRVHNNIVWAAPGRAILQGGRIEDYTLRNNVYFGDPNAKLSKADAGDTDNVIADPKLKSPSATGGPEDFRPAADSPAVGHGLPGVLGTPLADLTGKPRPPGRPTAGALLPADVAAR